MRANEIKTVLNAIAGYDGRTWPADAETAWLAIVGRYPLEDAIQAVREHYATSEKRIMPANIRTRCIQLREIREAAEARALPVAPPQVTEVGRAAQREIAAIVGRVAGRTEAAYRATPPDPTSPTTPTSDVTEAAKREQMARLRALQYA